MSDHSADAAEDELAFDLTLLHRVLVLAGRLRHLLGDVRIDLIDGDDAVAIQVGLPLQPLQEVVGEDPVAEVLALLAALARSASRLFDALVTEPCPPLGCLFSLHQENELARLIQPGKALQDGQGAVPGKLLLVDKIGIAESDGLAHPAIRWPAHRGTCVSAQRLPNPAASRASPSWRSSPRSRQR